MKAKRISICVGSVVIAFFLALLFAIPSAAQEEEGYSISWGNEYETLTIHYTGGEYRYPHDMLEDKFPAPGDPPYGKFAQEWPVVIMWARWTEPMADFPAKYRPRALDLVLMLACDAQIYEHVYPEAIRSAKFKYPPEFVKTAEEDLDYDLIDRIRGKIVEYEVTAKAGFAMSDYTIKTKIRMGASADEKTFFFYDKPEYISDYLSERDFFFAAHDTGNEIRCEAIMICVCKPGTFFKGETMRRIKETGKYFVERLYACFKGTFTEEEIEDYLEFVQSKEEG